MKLSILICTLPERWPMLNSLIAELSFQINQFNLDGQVEFIIDDRGREVTTGTKRNWLLQKVSGKYLCFFDDDDMPSESYLQRIFEGIEKGVDCCSLRGIMTTNGYTPEMFEHSLKYNEWKTTDNLIKYERYPNHLNCIKSEIAKQFIFPDKTIGEDHIWSTLLHESGLLKSEHYINEVIYHYQYTTK